MKLNMLRTSGVLALMTLLAACGSDDKVSSDGSATGGGSSSSSYSSAWSGDINTALGTYRSTVSCKYGGSRNTVVSYYINKNTGLGVYTSGYTSPVIGDIYLGRSYFGDLMAIQKVGSGSTVSGYNVYLELCDYSNNGVLLIGSGHSITNLGIDSMTLGSSASCTYDLVLRTSVWLEVGAYGNYAATSFPTSFFPIDTNLTTGRSACNNSSYSYWNIY